MMLSPTPLMHWARAIENPIFPAVDAALRSGLHITAEQIEWFAFLTETAPALHSFYLRYHVQLLRASEGFFYLLPQSNSLFPRGSLSLLEVLLGKILCLIHLNPDGLKNEGIWNLKHVLEELTALVDSKRLFALYQLRGCRGSGSAFDQTKLQERIRICLWRLKKLGFIIEVKAKKEGDIDSANAEFRFRITDAIFRFAAEIQDGKSLYDGQLDLVKTWQIVMSDLIE